MIARILIAAAALFVTGSAVAPPSVEFPEGYRRWVHVKSGIAILPGHTEFRGMHHVYANAEALEGYRTGRFPDGSVIVFDLLSVTSDAEGVRTGSRMLVDVMRKDAGAWPETAGWGYEEFRGDSHTERALGPTQGKAVCMGCHERLQTADSVITTFDS